MKKILALYLFMSVICFPILVLGSDTVKSKTIDVDCGDGNRKVTAVYVDLKDPSIKVETVLADKKIKSIDDLKNIAKQVETNNLESVAAINGSFFNSYSDNQPQGALIIKGDNVTLTTTGSTVSFTEQNEMKLDSVGMYLTGFINGDSQWPNN